MLTVAHYLPKLITKCLFNITFIVTIVSCAQQSALSGGEKDTTPPQYNKNYSHPKNGALNFTENKIDIVFDEFIKVNNPKKNIIITPRIEQSPIYETKGKRFILKFNENLDSNTTYTINFGDNISDITEGNKIDNFNYVFSTGNKLDSLWIDGYVFDAFTKKPLNKIKVGLYKNKSDSVAIKEQPFYFSSTNEDGLFRINNIKEGIYKLIALQDENNNFKYNKFSEGIAFLDTLVNVKYDTTRSPINLLIFKEEEESVWIESKKYIDIGKISLLLNKKIDTILINLLDNEFIDGSNKKEFTNTDSIGFWIKDINNKQSLKFTTSIDIKDTIFINFKKKKRDSILVVKTNTRDGLPYFKKLNLIFNTPIEKINSENIKLLNSDSLNISFNTVIDNNNVTISAKLKEDESYEFIALPNTFKDYYNRTNDSINIFFSLKPKGNYGSLILNYPKEDSIQHIIQLLKNNNVIEEFMVNSINNRLEFLNLLPGNYTLRAIVDNNNNNKWDSGNYVKKIFPEKVFVFEENIEVKSGWDLDLTWSR